MIVYGQIYQQEYTHRKRGDTYEDEISKSHHMGDGFFAGNFGHVYGTRHSKCRDRNERRRISIFDYSYHGSR